MVGRFHGVAGCEVSQSFGLVCILGYYGSNWFSNSTSMQLAFMFVGSEVDKAG